jgi:hypothetical protein
MAPNIIASAPITAGAKYARRLRLVMIGSPPVVSARQLGLLVGAMPMIKLTIDRKRTSFQMLRSPPDAQQQQPRWLDVVFGGGNVRERLRSPKDVLAPVIVQQRTS